MKSQSCPRCNTSNISIFYELKNVPAHSVLLFPTRKKAINYPKGDIILGFCQQCGFITNLVFDPNIHEYSDQYEETQGFSPTFNTFHQRLATYLIERYDLRNKDVIEIGCGKGEFLRLLCEHGNNRGVGFDPAYIEERNQSLFNDRIIFIKDFYSEKYSQYQADFVCCKMTLEHIHNTADFIRMVQKNISDRADTIVFFQVPDVMRILQETAFWDIYYEHCSYFSAGSLTRLFHLCGFRVCDLWKDYDEQYLMIVAKPGKEKFIIQPKNNLDELKSHVTHFSKTYSRKLSHWKLKLKKMYENSKRVVIWGAGSKAVAFLTTLNIEIEIQYAVDINPHKHNTYLAGTGQKIVSPVFLKEYRPDVVILMNSIYHDEIKIKLNHMGLNPKILVL